MFQKFYFYEIYIWVVVQCFDLCSKNILSKKIEALTTSVTVMISPGQVRSLVFSTQGSLFSLALLI